MNRWVDKRAAVDRRVHARLTKIKDERNIASEVISPNSSPGFLLEVSHLAQSAPHLLLGGCRGNHPSYYCSKLHQTVNGRTFSNRHKMNPPKYTDLRIVKPKLPRSCRDIYHRQKNHLRCHHPLCGKLRWQLVQSVYDRVFISVS